MFSWVPDLFETLEIQFFSHKIRDHREDGRKNKEQEKERKHKPVRHCFSEEIGRVQGGMAVDSSLLFKVLHAGDTTEACESTLYPNTDSIPHALQHVYVVLTQKLSP